MFDRSQYSSYANNTKWSELRDAMVLLYPRAPRFRVKILNRPAQDPSNWPGLDPWDGEWFYHFRSDYIWKDMEYVDLSPRAATGISLDDIEAICRRVGFEIERHDEFIRIIGYRRAR